MRERYLIQLDGLRTVAVAAVAWVHWAPARYRFGLPWGTGVQLFYVISGFLITGILLDVAGREGGLSSSDRAGIWRRFYARRILRIFPLFYAMLGLTFFLGVEPLAQTWKWHVTYLSNFYYFNLGHWGMPREPFRHLWSLSVEEQFYLVWPFVVLLVARRTLWKVLVGLILLAPMFRIIVGGMIADPAMSHALPFSCLDALGIGALLAYCVRFRNGAPDAASLARWCAIVGIPGAILGGVSRQLHIESFAAETLGHTCLVLFYGAIVFYTAKGFPGMVGRILEWSPLTYLGKISYGLYVIHLFAPLAVAFLADQAGLGAKLAASFPLQLVANVTFTVVAAMLSWHLFELPINNLKRFVPYDLKTRFATGIPASEGGR